MFVGLVGKVRKNYLLKEEGREGGEKKTCAARPRELGLGKGPHQSAARHEGCLDKQAFPCL